MKYLMTELLTGSESFWSVWKWLWSKSFCTRNTEHIEEMVIHEEEKNNSKTNSWNVTRETNAHILIIRMFKSSLGWSSKLGLFIYSNIPSSYRTNVVECEKKNCEENWRLQITANTFFEKRKTTEFHVFMRIPGIIKRKSTVYIIHFPSRNVIYDPTSR